MKAITTLIAETDNMKALQNFYHKVLGLDYGYQSPHWTTFEVGDVRIALHPTYSEVVGSPGGRGWVLGFAVEDIVDLRARLTASGVTTREFHDTPGGVVMDFQDPDGNRLQAMQVGKKIADL
jgi:predicted enzyme related to lactoylglutathione lyase